MANEIITSVTLDVDHKSMDDAERSTNNMVMGLGKATKAAAGVAAAVAVISVAFSKVDDLVRQSAEAAADFSNEIDSVSRGRLLETAEVLEAGARERQRIMAQIASDLRGVSETVDTIKTDILEGVAAAVSFVIPGIDMKARAEGREENTKQEKLTLEANETLFLASQDRMLLASKRFVMDRAEFQLARQAQALKEQDALIHLNSGTNNKDFLILERERMEETFNISQEFAAKEEQDRLDKLTEGLVDRNAAIIQDAEERAQTLQAIEARRLKEQLDDGILNEKLYTESIRLSRIELDQELERIAEQANQVALRAHEEQVNAMFQATNSLLRYADRELQQIFRAMDDLVRLLQSMDVLRGAGGIFGAISGGPGGFGSGTGSNGGPSGFGGISMGNTYISVAGGNTNADTAKTLDNQLRQTMTAIANQQIGYANQPGGQTFPGIERQR